MYSYGGTTADPFISTEPEVEVDDETTQILRERVQSAENGHLVSAAEARERIHQWLSKASTSKNR